MDRDRSGRGGRPDQRDRRDDLAVLLTHQRQLDQSEPGPTRLLRQRDPQQTGLGKLAPELTVEALGGGLHRFYPLGRSLVAENVCGQGAQRVLVFSQ